jgi:ribosomal protein L31E
MLAEEIMRLRTDRFDEIDICLGTILKTRNNIYLYGERGIGKTFLLKTLYNEILKEDNKVFPFFLNLFSLSRDSIGHGEYAFSSFLALELIKSIWEEIYKKSHSDLINKAISPEAGDSNLKKINFLQKVYANLRASLYKMDFTSENNIGVKAIISGNIKINETESREYGQLLPFEVISYIEEIKNYLKVNEKKIKIVALCDEANLMSEEWQQAVLTKHIDIFSNIGIQFVFVAGYLIRHKDIIVPNSFEKVIEITGINKDYIEELLQKHYQSTDFKIKPELVDYLWKKTNGNPRRILSIASEALVRDYKNNKIEITKELIDYQINEEQKIINTLPNTRYKKLPGQ